MLQDIKGEGDSAKRRMNITEKTDKEFCRLLRGLVCFHFDKGQLHYIRQEHNFSTVIIWKLGMVKRGVFGPG